MRSRLDKLSFIGRTIFISLCITFVSLLTAWIVPWCVSPATALHSGVMQRISTHCGCVCRGLAFPLGLKCFAPFKQITVQKWFVPLESDLIISPPSLTPPDSSRQAFSVGSPRKSRLSDVELIKHTRARCVFSMHFQSVVPSALRGQSATRGGHTWPLFLPLIPAGRSDSQPARPQPALPSHYI